MIEGEERKGERVEERKGERVEERGEWEDKE